jgi:hypothetical protein
MCEDETVLEYVSPLTALMQERVDRILLAVAGRLFEWNRDMTPAGKGDGHEMRTCATLLNGMHWFDNALPLFHT